MLIGYARVSMEDQNLDLQKGQTWGKTFSIERKTTRGGC